MPKPTLSTAWATDPSALKVDPSGTQQTYGWTTSDNTIYGVPVRPNLQQQNGWQNAVHEWKEYFEATTDQNISAISDNAQAISDNAQDISDNAQAISDNATDISDLSALVGIGVPLGGIIGVASHLTGTFTASSGAVVGGFILCDGASIPGGNAVSGTTPNLTDGRFLRGSTVAGVTGGSNTANLAHSHTVNSHSHTMSHTHNMKHTHAWMHKTGSGGAGAERALTNNTSNNASTVANQIAWIYNGAGGGYGLFGGAVGGKDDTNTNRDGAYYTSGAVSANSGSGSGANTGGASSGSTGTSSPSTNSALSSVSTEPQYLTVKYFMRVN